MIREDSSLRDYANYELYPTPRLIWHWLESQFGMPQQAFQSYQLWHRPGRGAIWIAHSNVPNAGVLAVETVGMQVTRRPPPRAKPSTYFAQKIRSACYEKCSRSARRKRVLVLQR